MSIWEYNVLWELHDWIEMVYRQRWRDGSVIKSTSCSSKGHEFGSQQLHFASQPSTTLVPNALTPSSGLSGYFFHQGQDLDKRAHTLHKHELRYAHMHHPQNTHIHTNMYMSRHTFTHIYTCTEHMHIITDSSFTKQTQPRPQQSQSQEDVFLFL